MRFMLWRRRSLPGTPSLLMACEARSPPNALGGLDNGVGRSVWYLVGWGSCRRAPPPTAAGTIAPALVRAAIRRPVTGHTLSSVLVRKAATPAPSGTPPTVQPRPPDLWRLHGSTGSASGRPNIWDKRPAASAAVAVGAAAVAVRGRLLVMTAAAAALQWVLDHHVTVRGAGNNNKCVRRHPRTRARASRRQEAV
jgi:hypothetical protein